MPLQYIPTSAGSNNATRSHVRQRVWVTLILLQPSRRSLSANYRALDERNQGVCYYRSTEIVYLLSRNERAGGHCPLS